MTEPSPPAETVADIVRRVRAGVPRLGPPTAPVRLLVVDGPAGSGKTTLANAVGAVLPAEVLHLDDIYGGWHGMEEAWARLDAWVLRPLERGVAGRYRRFDWTADRWAEWHDVPLAPFLVVEGCSAARREADEVACLAVWVEAPDEVRLRRGLDRDGSAMRPHWLEWMAAEREHFARERTPERADLRVDEWGRPVG